MRKQDFIRLNNNENTYEIYGEIVMITKEEAIHVSAKLLKNVFLLENPYSVKATAAVCAAESDGDAKALCNALDRLIALCNNLKKSMEE